MTPFDFITVALSIILGLGITDILSSSLRLFKARKSVELDWVPFVWAFCIFTMHLQFWWAIFELPNFFDSWSLFLFLSFVALAVFLFVAAYLILPVPEGERTDMQAEFYDDGKYALMVLSVYGLMVFGVNWIYWQASPFSLSQIPMWLVVIIPWFAAFAKSRKMLVVMTVIYFLMVQYASYVNSPKVYGG